MKSRYVLKNRKKFYMFVLTTGILLATLVFAGTAYGYKESAYSTVSVKSGDTLWDIARRYSKNEDIRKYIYKIKKINHLVENDIYIGTQLKLPAQ